MVENIVPNYLRLYLDGCDKNTHTVMRITKSDLTKAKFVSLIAPMFNETIVNGEVRRSDIAFITIMNFVSKDCVKLSRMCGKNLIVSGRKTEMDVFNTIARFMLWTPRRVTQEPTVKGYERRNQKKISVYAYSSKLDISLSKESYIDEVNKAFMDKEYLIQYSKTQIKSVYIVECQHTSTIKIGISNNPVSRLATMQTNHPFPLVLLRVIHTQFAAKLEKTLHKALGDFRLHGEWFDSLALMMIGDYSPPNQP